MPFTPFVSIIKNWLSNQNDKDMDVSLWTEKGTWDNTILKHQNQRTSFGTMLLFVVSKKYPQSKLLPICQDIEK